MDRVLDHGMARSSRGAGSAARLLLLRNKRKENRKAAQFYRCAKSLVCVGFQRVERRQGRGSLLLVGPTLAGFDLTWTGQPMCPGGAPPDFQKTLTDLKKRSKFLKMFTNSNKYS